MASVKAIDVILAIWEREPPYDIDLPGNRFKVSTAKTQVPALARRSMELMAGEVMPRVNRAIEGSGRREFA